MDDITSQELMSLLSPPTGKGELTDYFVSIGKALSVTTDASLARVLNISASTLANWKRRGEVPEDGRQQVLAMLIEKIGTYVRSMPNVGSAAREGVVEFLMTGGTGPFDDTDRGIRLNALALPGLLLVAELIDERLFAIGHERSPGDIAAHLRTAILHLKNADPYRLGLFG